MVEGREVVDGSVVAIIQARMLSTRLPGKVIKEICGRPMLLHLVERISRASSINRIVVATTTDVSDDCIEILCRNNNIDCFRGDSNDVLDRFYRVGRKYPSEHYVRITADNPLVDAGIIDQIVLYHKENRFDYTSNSSFPWSFPYGIIVEVFRSTALRQAYFKACGKLQREHVTLYFFDNEKEFSIGKVVYATDYSGYRLTVDYPEDFIVVNEIFCYFYPKIGIGFSWLDAVAFLKDNKRIANLNSSYLSYANFNEVRQNGK